jgi:multiple sugar transport system permease protein
VAQPFSDAGPALPVQRRFSDRNFKYLLVVPSIFVLLLIGIFPLVYLLVVSFQGITMTETDTAFVGLRNYALLFHDRRLWESLLHTVIS